MENTGAICYYLSHIAERDKVVKRNDMVHTFIHLRRNGGPEGEMCSGSSVLKAR
jgi:hypothetical protein